MTPDIMPCLYTHMHTCAYECVYNKNIYVHILMDAKEQKRKRRNWTTFKYTSTSSMKILSRPCKQKEATTRCFQ